MISEKLFMHYKSSPIRGYKLAHKAGMDPSTLSKLMCGIQKAKPGDVRLIKVGKLLGVPADECFKDED